MNDKELENEQNQKLIKKPKKKKNERIKRLVKRVEWKMTNHYQCNTMNM